MEKREEGRGRGRTGNDIGKGFGGSSLALRVPGFHNFNLDTEDSLTEQDVSNGGVDEITNRLNFHRIVNTGINEWERGGRTCPE